MGDCDRDIWREGSFSAVGLYRDFAVVDVVWSLQGKDSWTVSPNPDGNLVWMKS